MNQSASPRQINLFDIAIDNLTMPEAIARIDSLVRERRNAYVVTPNVDHVVKLQNDPLFKKIYDNAALVIADGMPLVWASRLLNKPLKERVTGADMFPKVCELAAKKGYAVFLLGANEGVAAKAAQSLRQTYPGLNICGTYSPSYGFEKNAAENQAILKMLDSAKPDILFVGVGAPKQEKWIYQYRDQYAIPLSLGVGASFDFVAGSLKRAPFWMQKLGFEWFYRFLMEPRRLFKRYFIDGARYFGLTFGEWRKSRR
jgi:N-acetylglucosaminyldiphosphoundecaprenol N-acetyl-beta-D-mannosaminyltransferase